DSLMIKYYELLSMGDAAHLEVIQQGRVHPMEAKKQLAAELVTRFYSEAAAEQAAADFAQRFQRRELPSDMETFAWSGQEPAVWSLWSGGRTSASLPCSTPWLASRWRLSPPNRRRPVIVSSVLKPCPRRS